MRASILMVVLWFMPSLCFGQEEQGEAKQPKTKLEIFQSRTGSVLIRGFSEIGTLRGKIGGKLTVEVKEFTDAGSGRKEYGLTVEVISGGQYEREDTSYIDYDEIDGLIKGLDYIGMIDKSVTQLSEFQADYKTKGDLTVSTYSGGLDGNIGLAVTSGSIGTARIFLDLSDLAVLRELIVQGKSQLDNIRPATIRAK